MILPLLIQLNFFLVLRDAFLPVRYRLILLLAF
jgi:hypothetical protein